MSGILELNTLLATLTPQLDPACYVFVTLPQASLADAVALQPLALYVEEEGVSAVLEQGVAARHGLDQDLPRMRRITLCVHSSLEAVGLTAAVAGRLAAQGISANVIAAYYHDHVFVPAARADEALALLQALQREGV